MKAPAGDGVGGAAGDDPLVGGLGAERRAERAGPAVPEREEGPDAEPVAQPAGGLRHPARGGQAFEVGDGGGEPDPGGDPLGDGGDGGQVAAGLRGLRGGQHDQGLGPGGGSGVEDRHDGARGVGPRAFADQLGGQDGGIVGGRHRGGQRQDEDVAVPLGVGHDHGELAGRRGGGGDRLVEPGHQVVERDVAVAVALVADQQPQGHDPDAVAVHQVGRQRGGAVGHDGDCHDATTST